MNEYLKAINVQYPAHFLDSLFGKIRKQTVILKYFYDISFALKPSAGFFTRLKMSFKLEQPLGLVHEAAHRQNALPIAITF